MSDNLYQKLSSERKAMQAAGDMPQHWTTGSWQLFKNKYLYQASTPREQYQRIARTLAVHTKDPEYYSDRFFDIMWKGWLSPSTPILANTGTTRGLPVSCAGTYVDDSIFGIYHNKLEVAMLTKHGFGTASYLGDVRCRGAEIFGGGKSSGILPIIQGFQLDMEYVAQGTARRGSWAGYIPIDHGDFDEVIHYLEANPDGNNIGWNLSAAFIERLENRDPEALRRYAQAMVTKMKTGKGYFFFPDKANAKRPKWYVDRGLDIKAAQLCNEITLHSSSEYTYTCVLASMNLLKWDEWKDTDAVRIAIYFLDSVAQEFIERAKNIRGLEKAVAFTRKSRALGLGACGLHTLFQSKMLPFDGFEARMLNVEIFKHMREEAELATAQLAKWWGEPEWCKGYGRANSHLLAIAPTKSTAMFMGGISEGIGQDTAFVYTQRSAGGEIDRVNPYLLKIMKEQKVYNKRTVEDIRIAHMGSVQHVDWLTPAEKLVFRTAFETDQHSTIDMAISRGKYVDQWQSLNVYFAAGSSEAYINSVHKKAIQSEDVLGLYYIYSSAAVQASSDQTVTQQGGECIACQ